MMNEQAQDLNASANRTSASVSAASGHALGTVANLPAAPPGYTPLGDGISEKVETLGINPAEIPQTIEQLGELLSFTYDLTVRRAAELNIPVISNVSGGLNKGFV